MAAAPCGSFGCHASHPPPRRTAHRSAKNTLRLRRNFHKEVDTRLKKLLSGGCRLIIVSPANQNLGRRGLSMENEVILGNVMVDCDDEKKLQKFYGELLGWEMCELFARPAVRSSTGIVFLFIEEAEYICPVWPEETGKQQKQIHFDFQVDNVMEMVKKAERLGATKSKAQFGGSDFVTMFDPAGHPFCLCQK